MVMGFGGGFGMFFGPVLWIGLIVLVVYLGAGVMRRRVMARTMTGGGRRLKSWMSGSRAAKSTNANMKTGGALWNIDAAGVRTLGAC